MFLLPGSHISTGVEISAGNINTVNVSKAGRRYTVQDIGSINIPENTFKSSFKHLNILEPEKFSDCLGKLSIKSKKKRLSIALPDECSRIFIRPYRELPDSRESINEMVMWDTANLIKAGELSEMRCAWEYKGQNPGQEHVFIVAALMEAVIEQYENLFQGQGMKIDRIMPAGLARYNFYAPDLSASERIAFLNLFDQCISIFIFDKGVPLLYKTLRKGLIGKVDASATDELDLLLQYCRGEMPDTALDRIVIATDKVLNGEVAAFLTNYFDAGDFHVADEQKLMDFSRLNDSISFYNFSAALGAAKRVW